MIEQIRDSLLQPIYDWLAALADLAYIGGFYTIGLILLLAVGLVVFFFRDIPIVGRWISAAGGIVVLGYALVLLGMTLMYRHGSTEREALRTKIKELQQQRQKPGGFFGF